MRSYLTAALFCLLILYTPASAAGFNVIQTDGSQWPEVRVLVEAPESAAEADAYSLTTPGSDAVPASRIMEITGETRPASLVVAVDTSRSLSPVHLDAVKRSLSRYVEQLDQGEQIALLAFNDTVELATGFSADREAFVKNLDKLVPAGKITELNRAILYGVDLLKNLPGKRTLLVLTDGKDEGRVITQPDVIEAAQENKIHIYSIGIPALSGRENKRYRESLQELSAATGGQYRDASTADELGTAVMDLLLAQRSPGSKVYALSFSMPEMQVNAGQADMTLTYSRDGKAWQDKLTVDLPAQVNKEVVPSGDASQENLQESSYDGLRYSTVGLRESVPFNDPEAIWQNDSDSARERGGSEAARGFITLLANTAENVEASALNAPQDPRYPSLSSSRLGVTRQHRGQTEGGYAIPHEDVAMLSATEEQTREPYITSSMPGSITPVVLEDTGRGMPSGSGMIPGERTLQRYWPWFLGGILCILLLFLLYLRRKGMNGDSDKGSALVIDFPELNRSYLLHPGTMLLGSAPGNAITLNEPGIANAHASFCTGNGCTIQNLLTAEDVKLNGEALEEPRPLKAGDYLEFGAIRALIRYPVLHENGTSAVGAREAEHE